MQEMIDYIRKVTPLADRYEQLAEELVEAAHAALKLARVIRGVSPTPVNEADAFTALKMEIGDVLAVMDVTVSGINYIGSRIYADEKVKRWYERLKGVEHEQSVD